MKNVGSRREEILEELLGAQITKMMMTKPSTEVGEITDSGVHAVLHVEVEPSPEHVFVTTPPQRMEENIVLDLQLKLNLATSPPVQLHARTFGMSVVC